MPPLQQELPARRRSGGWGFLSDQLNSLLQKQKNVIFQSLQ
jgi:hypothetical protein